MYNNILFYIILQDLNNIQRIKGRQQILEEADLQKERTDILKEKVLLREREDFIKQKEKQYELDTKELLQQNKALTQQLEHLEIQSDKSESQKNTQIMEGAKNDDTNPKVICLY